jgi:hypothetical protein
MGPHALVDRDGAPDLRQSRPRAKAGVVICGGGTRRSARPVRLSKLRIEPEGRTAVGDQHECVALNAVSQAHHAHDEVEEPSRVAAGEEIANHAIMTHTKVAIPTKNRTT